MIEGPVSCVRPREARAICRKFDWENTRYEYRSSPDPDVRALGETLADLWQTALRPDPRDPEESPSDAGSNPRKWPEAGQRSEEARTMTATEVADQIGVTSRAVRLAAAEQRLEGQLATNGWLFTTTAVAQWANNRKQHRNALP